VIVLIKHGGANSFGSTGWQGVREVAGNGEKVTKGGGGSSCGCAEGMWSKPREHWAVAIKESEGEKYRGRKASPMTGREIR